MRIKLSYRVANHEKNILRYRSFMNTSNVQGIVRIWRKTANQVEFVVEGGHYQTNAGNWNFELGPDTNTLNQTLHISAPINH